MEYKYLILFILVCMSAEALCQQADQKALTSRLLNLRAEAKTVSLNQADTTRSDNDIVPFNVLMAFSNLDTIQRCDTVSRFCFAPCDTIIRNNIIGKARDYIGIPYHYGQSSEKGFDCSGFVRYVFRDFGLELPHSSFAQYKMSKHLKVQEAHPGDLVFFITRGKSISHVGIYLGEDQFIHSPGRGRSVSIDSLSSKYFKRHLVGFGKVLYDPD